MDHVAGLIGGLIGGLLGAGLVAAGLIWRMARGLRFAIGYLKDATGGDG